MHKNTRYTKAKNITLIGAVINLALGILKVFGGVFFKSHALIADGIHSFSDLFTDAMVLVASKYGSAAADENHPYGHQKIETAATLLLAMLLILAGFGIAWDSLNVLLSKSIHTPIFLAIPVVFISIIANEMLFHFTIKVGEEIKSPLVIANAWHHRSDAASSVVVLVGIVGSLFGYNFLDPIAAIIIGGMIVKMGVSYGWNSVKELVDTGIDKQELFELEKIINSVEGVKKTHQLRSRMMGKDMFVDVHILVSPLISVSEGHHIAQRAHKKLKDEKPIIKDVTIHVDPEDDETSSPSLHLPSRISLENSLIKNWQMEFPEIKSWTIHYIDGKIAINITIDKSFQNWEDLAKILKKDIQNNQQISIIHLLNFQEEIIVLSQEKHK